MVKPKTKKTSSGKEYHYSVGAIIKQDNKYLLIERMKIPFGYAGLAGHVDIGEKPEDALVREIREESGYTVTDYKLLHEEKLDRNKCSKGINSHYWYLYECEIKGDLKMNNIETKDIGWFTIDEINKLKLEPVWRYWFEKEGIINSADRK